jgi:glutamate 5-kinase
VKIGSSSLTASTTGLDPEAVRAVAENVAGLWDIGHPTVLVTSAAVAAGLPAMGLETRPTDLPGLQVAAAVGQGRLMEVYAKHFGELGRGVGQVLLTRDVLARRNQYLHAREALERMLLLGIVPVVNENDTVVVDELRFGDNDRLAAIVSHLVSAGMLILLTDTSGIYSEDPLVGESPQLLSAVKHTDEVLDELRRNNARGEFGSGGVATKVSAARMAAWSGVPTVIAASDEPDVVKRAAAGDEVGTWVEPHDSRLPARKLWIAFGLPSEGSISVDHGAASAIKNGGKSLLAVGIVDAEGSFESGAAVEVTSNGSLIAKGLVAMSSASIRDSRGQHSSVAGGEVIHRDDLVVLA